MGTIRGDLDTTKRFKYGTCPEIAELNLILYDLVPHGADGRIAGYMIFGRASRLWSVFLRELAALLFELSGCSEAVYRFLLPSEHCWKFSNVDAMETQARRMVLANNGHHGDSDDDERERGKLMSQCADRVM